MPDAKDINRRIAKLRGWKSLRDDAPEMPGLVGIAPGAAEGDWGWPLTNIPAYDTDPAMMLVLLEEMRMSGRQVVLYNGLNSWHIDAMIMGQDADVGGCGDTLPAAVAAAWVAWKEAQ